MGAMEANDTAAEAALRSLDSVISEALRGGATVDDIARIVRISAKGINIHANSSSSSSSSPRDHSQKSTYSSSSRDHSQKSTKQQQYHHTSRALNPLYVFVACAAALTIANLLAFRGPELQQYLMHPADNAASHSNNPTDHFDLPQIRGKGIISISSKSKSNGNSRSLWIQRAIADYNNPDITRFLLDLDLPPGVVGAHYDPIASLPDEFNFKTDANLTCPLDVFVNLRGGFCDDMYHLGTICIFPGGVIKKAFRQYWKHEARAVSVLNDTRFFPEVFHVSSGDTYGCRTVVEENVRPLRFGQFNRWYHNYSEYQAFYESAFRFFDEHQVIPTKLDAVDRSVVYGGYMRIVDGFTHYDFNATSDDKRREENKKILSELLEDVVDEIKYSAMRAKCMRILPPHKVWWCADLERDDKRYQGD